MKPKVISLQYSPQVVVVAHSELTTTPHIMQMLHNAKHIVVCDGALEQYLTLTHRPPDAVVGDGDSLPAHLLHQLNTTFVQIAEQDTNDLTKAINYTLQQGWNNIAIVGGTGRREDHTLGNITLLAHYQQLGAEVRMVSAYGTFIPFRGEVVVPLQQGQQLSFFALTSAPMSARGVKYPFEERTFTELWQATLNEALGGEVWAKSSGPALIYIANEVKKA